MAVKLRLRRTGRTHMAMYQIVAADSRCPRDGRFIEKIGTYNPHVKFDGVNINHELALKWLGVGAQPTDTVRSFLSNEGILMQHHLKSLGKSPEEITKSYTDWKAKRDLKIQTEKALVEKKKADDKATRLTYEKKVRQEKMEKIQSKKTAGASPANEQA